MSQSPLPDHKPDARWQSQSRVWYRALELELSVRLWWSGLDGNTEAEIIEGDGQRILPLERLN
jgi:hypothetical protein